jgi:YbgC/YbaW family acyl-CoA thioester hydrolase
MHELHTRRKVEFADTDMGGIVHFSRFFVYMETAEHEFLNALGTEIHQRHEGRLVGWPRLAAACEYLSPARLGDELAIHLEVERKGRTSMTYRFTFRCGERLVARGRVSSACCVLDDPGGLATIPIPTFLVEQIEEAPAGAG